MAYKFQSGAAIASGSLVQEGLLDIKGSLQISGSSAIDASRNFAGGSATFTGDVSSSSDLTLGADQDVKFGGTDVLNLTSLGSTVLASSLTSVGTLSSLNVGNVTSTGILSGTTATLAVGGAVSIGGASVLNATTLGSAVAASSLTSVGTLVGVTSSQPIIAQVGVRSSGPLSGSGDLTLGAGGDVKFGGTDVLNLTELGSTVLASSLTSVGTLSSLGVGAITSTGVVSSSNDGRFLALDINSNANVIDSSANFAGATISGSGDLTLGAGSDMQIGGTDVLSATTLGSTVLASSLTSVGTLSSLGVGAVTSTGIVSSSNDGRFLALDINGNEDIIDSSANFSGGSVTAQLKISSSAGISGSSGKFLGLMSASHFVGNGAGLSNVEAVTAITSSTGDVNYELAFAEYLGSDVELGGNAGLYFRPKNLASGHSASFVVSGTHGGFASSSIGLGSVFKAYTEWAEDDSAYITNLYALQGAIDISASSGGIVLYGGTGEEEGIDLLGTSVRVGANDEDDPGITFTSAGVISGSGDLTLGAGAGIDIGGSNVLNRGTLGSTVLASSLTSLGTQGEALNMGGYGISNVGGLTSSLGVRVQGYGLFVNDLTRSAGDLNIKLHDASANNVGFRLASGTKPLVVYSTNYVGVTSLTASSGVQFDSTVQLDGAGDVSASIQADSVYFRDASTGLIKRDSFVDIVSAIAGAGITATGGVLSTQAQSVTSGSNAFGAVTLVEGYNYFGDVTGTMVATLPSSPTVGDVVNVKAKSISSSKSIKITGSAAHTIDGDGYINIESSYGAVGLVYVASNDWRVV